MIFSSLHRQLGVEPSELTFELIDLALERGVEEQDDLDWKQAIPAKDKHEEFAKDVAAMANSAGGLLVFGVSEKPGSTSAAGGIVHVEAWGDNEERRLRQVAYSNIQPAVHGVTFRALEQDGRRIVILDVPASADAPHLVWSGAKFTAPIRYGAQTEYMNERQIETAYATRRSARTGAKDRADEIAQDAIATATSAGQIWLSIVAIPIRPRSAHLPRLTSEDLTQIVTKASKQNPFTGGFGPLTVGISPRPRFRRWVTTSVRNEVANKVIEVHDDGTVLFATALQGLSEDPGPDVLPNDLHNGPAEAMALICAAATSTTTASEYVLRTDVHADTWPIYFREGPQGFVEDRENPIRRFEPVETIVNPHADTATLHASVWTLVTDILNQGGTREPSTRYLHEPPHPVVT